MTRPTLALCLALAFAAAPAQARPSRASVRLNDAVALAQAYWPEACQPAAWITDADWSQYDGISIESECAWGMDPAWPTWTWIRLCTTVVHEFGHLAGQPHSNDPTSIMAVTGRSPSWGVNICGRTPRSSLVVVYR